MKPKLQKDKNNKRLLGLLNQTQLRDQTGSWEWKQEEDIFVWSDAMFALHEIPPTKHNELSKAAALAFMMPRDKVLFEVQLAALAPDGETQFNSRIKASNGEKKKIQIIAYRLTDEKGQEAVFGEYRFVPVAVKQTNSTNHIAALPATNGHGHTKIVGGPADGITPEIAEQLRATAQLQALNASLQEKNRQLEQMNEEHASFAFIASHDLREPLRKLQLFSDILRKQHAQSLPDDVKEYLLKIDGAAQRMNALIDDVLVFSRISEYQGAPEPVDLTDTLAQVREDLYEAVTESCALLHPFELPLIKGHSSMLYQLFFNFVSNSLKFRKPGLSPVIIIRGLVKQPWEWPGTNPAPALPWLQLSFTDNGIGIEEKYTETIFKMFQRLHDKDMYPGTGIGLAICKKIAAMHQGYIDVKSEPGKGTTFTCYLQVDIIEQ